MNTIEEINYFDLMGILHDEDKDKIVIDFRYDGNNLKIEKGQIELDKDAWVEFKKTNISDVEMIKRLLECEFLFLSEWLD